MNFESIYATQRKHWWWPDLKKQIREEWEKCEDCLRCKKSKTQAPPLYPLDAIAYDIGEYWSTDLFEFRGRYFILGIDKASQFMFIEELKNKKTETVTKALEKFALMLGLPTVLKSDGGPCFKSKPFSHFVEKYAIHHVMTLPYHHQSNGQAERGIQEAKR